MPDDNHNNQKRQFPVEYWMVCCEWDQVYEEPTIATPENPGAQGRRFMKRESCNQAINVHPVVHCIRMLQTDHLNFTITFAMPISKEYFDLIMQPHTTEQSIQSEKLGGIH